MDTKNNKRSELGKGKNTLSDFLADAYVSFEDLQEKFTHPSLEHVFEVGQFKNKDQAIKWSMDKKGLISKSRLFQSCALPKYLSFATKCSNGII